MSISEKDTFDKKCTLMTKGILVVMLLTHHLFYPGEERYELYFFGGDKTVLKNIVAWCKLCIAGYAFLSTFGMTRSIMAVKEKTNNFYLRFICRRVISFEMTVIFIYCIASLYKTLIIREPFWRAYMNDSGFQLTYLLFDMLGMGYYFGTPELNVTWWYVHYAVVLILMFPFLHKLYENFRYLLVPVIIVVPFACASLPTMAGVQNNFIILLPTAFLGIMFAYENVFEKFLQKMIISKKAFIYFFAGAFIIYVSYLISKCIKIYFVYVFVVTIPCMVFLFIRKIPILHNLLEFIGKHSTNIFLTHTFVYYYFYGEFIYSFKYAGIIILVMLIICIGMSYVINLLKRITFYNKFTNNVLNKIDGMLASIEA